MLEDMPDRMAESVPEDMQDRISRKKICQINDQNSDTECQKILQIEYKIMSNRILVDHSKERHLCFFAGIYVILAMKCHGGDHSK